jgi:hypothetical protein
MKVNPKCTDKHEDLNIASLYPIKTRMVWMIAKIAMEEKECHLFMRSNLHKHLGWRFVQSNTGKNQVKTKEKCGKSNKFVPPKNSNMDYKCAYVHSKNSLLDYELN